MKAAVAMGPNTQVVFAGKGASCASRQMYGKTATYFAREIRSRLPLRKKPYNLLDIGSHEGELLTAIITLLPEYSFTTIAVEINPEALEKNRADIKICSSASSIQLQDKTVDVCIMRYVLHQNTFDEQGKILTEILRVTSGFVLVEHVGPQDYDALQWRENIGQLFSGEFPKLYRREPQFFSAVSELKILFNALNVRHVQLRDECVEGLSDVLEDRYHLSVQESEKIKRIIEVSDFARVTGWCLF